MSFHHPFFKYNRKKKKNLSFCDMIIKNLLCGRIIYETL